MLNKTIFERILLFFNGQMEFGVLNVNSLWRVEAVESRLHYLEKQNNLGNHIFMRPQSEVEANFLLIDDLDMNDLLQDHSFNGNPWKPGRMIIETSPANFQVWIRLSRILTNDEKKYWLKQFRSDPGCSPKHRWGRAPGFYNMKLKHKTEAGYPLVKPYTIDVKESAQVPIIMGISDQPEQSKVTSKLQKLNQLYKAQDRHGHAFIVDSSIKRDDYQNGDRSESEVDFAFIIALISRGYCDEAIEQRIISERDDWTHHKGSEDAYLTRSIANAHDYLQSQQN
jgi:hypothetical protein